MFWLISIFIITSRKDERTEADRSVCFIWFLSGLCLFLRRVVFMPAKPMWKLYLVWAILSSVTLLYVISSRCNVMSTIKTHTHLLAVLFLLSPFIFEIYHGYSTHPSRDEKDSPSFSPSASVKYRRCVRILTGSEDLSASLFFCVLCWNILGAASRCHQTSQSPPGLFCFSVGIQADLVWCGLMKSHAHTQKNMIPGWQRERELMLMIKN